MNKKAVSKKTGKKDIRFLVAIAVVLVVIVAGILLNLKPTPKGPGGGGYGGTTDDWQYNPQANADGMLKGGAPGGVQYATGAMPSAAENLGFAVGGAKDINNFRENIKNNYLPIPTDLTYEGLFYGYYFDTGQTEACNKLFCPSYSYAISKDPLSRGDDYYLSVGLNSGIKESDFERKKLNLVIVLDISGSMGSPFNQYYYDQFGNQQAVDESEPGKSKVKVAAESIVALLDHLNDDDRFGMVLYDDVAYLAKPMKLVGDTDMDALKEHILELAEQGGTNMEAGLEKGTELFKEVQDADPEEYENRIIFLTDAQPNTGDTSESGLMGMTKKNAENRIYLTFIGMGVDFNTELTEALTKIRGANYYSVHSSNDFKKRMDDEFEFMVTPLVFNLVLKLEATGYDIEKVYGSPEADESTGEIMKVNTLFPSKTEEGQTKGGIILLKLKKTSPNASLKLKASYEDRNGKEDSDEKSVTFGSQASDYYQNSGIRKATLLARYADLMKNWVIDERAALARNKEVVPSITTSGGITIPVDYALGEWERQSSPLHVSSKYKELFQVFAEYFNQEMDGIGDETLSQEYELLAKLSDFAG